MPKTIRVDINGPEPYIAMEKNIVTTQVPIQDFCFDARHDNVCQHMTGIYPNGYPDYGRCHLFNIDCSRRGHPLGIPKPKRCREAEEVSDE